MSGGGGDGQQVLGTWSPTMTGYWAGPDGSPERGFLERVARESQNPYERYGGDRVAGLNPWQTGAGDAMYGAAMNGTALGNAGREHSRKTVEGEYLDTARNFGSNEYGGMSSPYFTKQLELGQGKITDAYKKGTALDTTRAANLQGAFGGSNHMGRVKDNEEALAGQLDSFTTSMLQNQYDRSAGLKESELGRNAGLYGQERGLMAGLTGGAMGNDASAISNYMAAMGYGDKRQKQSQAELDDEYSRWSEGQNWNRNNLGWLAQMLGMAQGSTGMTTQTGGYGGINPAAGLLGAASLYGAMR